MKDQQNEAHLHALDYWQVIRNRYGVILLAFFLVFMTSAVVTAIMPKKYLGKVQIEVQRSSNEDNPWADPGAEMRKFSSPTFLQTQFKIITSKETLYRVIDKLNLVEKWRSQGVVDKETAYYRLFDMLEADEERNTDLINIEVYSQDAEEAAQLANEVAEAYRERRADLEKKRTELTLTAIEAQKQQQIQKVELARAKMITIGQDLKLVPIGQGAPGKYNRVGDVETASTAIYFDAIQEKQKKEREIADITSQLSSLREKSGVDLLAQATLLQLVDPATQQVNAAVLGDQATLAQMLNSGRGQKHPDVVALRSKIQTTQQMLNKQMDAIKTTLEAKLQTAQAVLDNMEKATEKVQGEAIEDRTRTVEYNKAKDDYDLQRSILDKMIETTNTGTLSVLLPKQPVTIHESAVTPRQHAKPHTRLQLILGALVGLILGLGFAFFLEYLDTSVKSLDDVERYLGVPVLAVIPKDVGILHKQSGLSPDAEAYRILRTNIEFNRKSADANAITVVSGGAGEGKSTTLVNLAFICAQGGYNTLMIDGDLRRPKLHTFFDINNSVGLTNYLTTELMLEDVILQTPIDNLYFMPSGILPADAAGILNSRRMSELIADVKNRFDLVLIDSPPILGVSDASVLASEVDLTMIVIQHRKLPRSMLLRVKQAIENVGGNLLGVVLNNVDVRSDNQYQYYTSYYTYYSPTNTEARSKPRPASASSAPAEKSSGKPGKPSKAAAPAGGDDEY